MLKEPGGVGWRGEYEMLLRKTKSQSWQHFGKKQKTGKKRERGK